ncbi:hypothetical protein Tco_0906210 [Tanacetum coccineum]
MGCFLTSWFSKKQTALAISTTEAEYVSARKACQQALWMKQALVDYGIIMCDNKGAIDLSKNLVQHSRTKHIEIRHHFLRDNVQKGNISIEKVSSEDNIADILTKPLKREPFNYLRLGLSGGELPSDPFLWVNDKIHGSLNIAENCKSIEDEEVSLVDGVLEGALGALGDERELKFRRWCIGDDHLERIYGKEMDKRTHDSLNNVIDAIIKMRIRFHDVSKKTSKKHAIRRCCGGVSSRHIGYFLTKNIKSVLFPRNKHNSTCEEEDTTGETVSPMPPSPDTFSSNEFFLILPCLQA